MRKLCVQAGQSRERRRPTSARASVRKKQKTGRPRPATEGARSEPRLPAQACLRVRILASPPPSMQRLASIGKLNPSSHSIRRSISQTATMSTTGKEPISFPVTPSAGVRSALAIFCQKGSLPIEADAHASPCHIAQHASPLGEGKFIQTAAMLVIGDEVLNGKTKDTNSSAGPAVDVSPASNAG